MGFIADVKFLANLLKSNANVVEMVEQLEKDCYSLKEQKADLNVKLSSMHTELRVLENEEKNLKKKIEVLKQNIDVRKEDICIMYQLQSVEFLKKLMQENDYVMEKLNIEKVIESTYIHSKGYGHYKNTMIDFINSNIQEFAAKEGISYEKLKKSLYDVNQAWFSCFNRIEKEYCLVNDSTTRLLLTSFMMIRKNAEKCLKELKVE